MASTSPSLSGTARPFEVFAASALIGLAFLHVGELPRQAANHGGVAFLGAWLLFLALLALPLVLTELMLGRRAPRSPIEGLAASTREADAKRGWRAAGWGMTAAALLGMALLALLAGGSVNFLARELELVDGTVQAAPTASWVLPVAAALLLALAAGLSALPARARALAVVAALAVILLLLAFAGLSGGGGMVALLYAAKPLSAADWQAAAQLALLGTGAGVGVLWLGGAALPSGTSLGRLGLLWLLVHAVLGGALLLALTPFVAVEQINANMALEIVPTGDTVLLALLALLLLGLFALLLMGGTLAAWLEDKGLARLPALAVTFAAALAVALALWLSAGPSGAKGLVTGLTQGLFILMALALLVQSVFAGWAMKISHARKTLNLPAEAIYNLWRVAVRLAVPLALLWVLAGLVRGFFA